MGPFVYSNSGHTAYGVKEYICDTNADIDLLSLDDTPGSSALVIETGDLYILNGSHEWKKQGGGSGNAGGSTTALEKKIKELEAQQKVIQEQITGLTAANKELTDEVEKLKAELEEKENVVINDTTVKFPEEAADVNAEAGTMVLDKTVASVKEDGTLILK